MTQISSNTFKYNSKVIQNKGKLVYEYNPLYNYRRSFNPINNYDDGTITDLITSGKDQLNFSLDHPVDIQCLESYDGSVNLILNDNYNQPRLINTRFTARENNTYERIDRLGNTDTNIYDESEFEIDTSLIKKYKNIPKILFGGVYHGGELPIGNYVFYFKLSDADGNETDVVAESGIVTIHIGSLNSPNTIRGGEQDENSGKLILFKLSNIDSGYDYVVVYYTRATAVDDKIKTVTATKVLNKFRVKSGICSINITGHEESEKVSVKEINEDFFIAAKAKTQAICLNMLIMGNVSKDTPDYENFSKVSMGFVPYYKRTKLKDSLGTLNELYESTDDCGYYNVKNIYNKVGYWNEEIYRFGIVYIMANGSLSPVYNIRGINEVPLYQNNINGTDYADWKDVNIDYDTQMINNLTLENSAGVCRINDKYIDSDPNSDSYFYLRNYVFVPQVGVKERLKELKVKGYFFVRQKRIPTILCQAFVLGCDTFSGIPAWKLTGNDENGDQKEYWVTETFLNGKGILTHTYEERLVPLDENTITNSVAICPEYELNQPYYNNIFTGGQIPIKQEINEYTLEAAENHIFAIKNYKRIDPSFNSMYIQSVPDSGMIRDRGNLFKARAGNPEEIKSEFLCNKANKPEKDKFLEETYSVKFVGNKVSFKKYNQDIKIRMARGNYGPYLGLYGVNNLQTNSLVNLYVPGYEIGLMLEYFKIRINCEEEFYPVIERQDLSNLDITDVFRGDCYISQFTHRINRNFLDPNAPNNEVIIDENTWIDRYNVDEDGKEVDLGWHSDVNRGDLNAIRMGTYITFKCYTTYNVAMRDFDRAFPAEESLTGSKRSFYPLSPIRVDGNYKIEESYIYNQGFSTSGGEKYNFLQPAVPYIKNTYQTRLIYSDIAQNDSFKNGFRTFKGISFRDYSGQFGGITKILEWEKNLVVIFEHAIAIVRVSENVMLPTDDGTKIAVGAVKAISDTPVFVSTDYGSQWADSICVSERFIYGVDTFAKKIWRVNSKGIEIISDLKVQKFLNENISLQERELSPILGIRNVKTHFNLFKNDIMFTFYDNLYGFEEKAWNLCFNEDIANFITFYSWLPSFSANILNVFFSYDRNTSKWIAKLALSTSGNPIVSGACVTDTVIDNWTFDVIKNMYYTELKFENRPVPSNEDITYNYSLERDNFGFYKYFNVDKKGPFASDQNKYYIYIYKSDYNTLFQNMIYRNPQYYCIQLNIKCNVIANIPDSQMLYKQQWDSYSTYNYGYYNTQMFLTTKYIFTGIPNLYSKLVTDFWKHGFAGIYDVQSPIKPCFWYGKQHPFEFEFVVGSQTPGYKLFENMLIVSNNIKPESAHYTIIGDSYDFSDLKPSIYFRQEATKAFYQYNGSDILFDHIVFDKIKGFIPKQITSSSYIATEDQSYNYLRDSSAVSYTYKDTLFPWMYLRQDTFNEIENYYKKIICPQGIDYVNISGCEIQWDSTLNQFSLCNHVKLRDIKNYGRMRGNLQYVNDNMSIQISPITVYNRNNTWTTENKPKLVLNNIPQEVYEHFALNNNQITNDDFPPELTDETYITKFSGINYTVNDIDFTNWNDIATKRSEIKLMDKYMKVKLRYDGKDLVMITAIGTSFNTSTR